jgi:hypothetical protein
MALTIRGATDSEPEKIELGVADYTRVIQMPGASNHQVALSYRGLEG